MRYRDLLNNPEVRAVYNTKYYGPGDYLLFPPADPTTGKRGETAYLIHRDQAGRMCCDEFPAVRLDDSGAPTENHWEVHSLPKDYTRPDHPAAHQHVGVVRKVEHNTLVQLPPPDQRLH